MSQDVTTPRAGESSSNKSACAAARSVHQLHRCRHRRAAADSIHRVRSAPPTPFPLHRHVCRRKMGRGTRLMTVLTAYLSSDWRVMRHLSNLNIFHWAVMVLSPWPAACECVPVCVRACVCIFVKLRAIGSAFEC